jgi:hypothetical protein
MTYTELVLRLLEIGLEKLRQRSHDRRARRIEGGRRLRVALELLLLLALVLLLALGCAFRGEAGRLRATLLEMKVTGEDVGLEAETEGEAGDSRIRDTGGKGEEVGNLDVGETEGGEIDGQQAPPGDGAGDRERDGGAGAGAERGAP